MAYTPIHCHGIQTYTHARCWLTSARLAIPGSLPSSASLDTPAAAGRELHLARRVKSHTLQATTPLR